jgi:Tfp pilus assembly protein PilX
MPALRSLTDRDQRGSVMLASLMFIAVMTLLGIALFDLATIEASLGAGDTVSTQLLACAEGALGRTMVDAKPATASPPFPGGRMTEIATLLKSTPGGTLTWTQSSATNPETPVATTVTTCTTTVTFTDDTTHARRLLQATSQAPNGTQRSVRIQLNYLPGYFQYVAVGDNGGLYIGGALGPGGDGCTPLPCGSLRGGAPSQFAGGADIFNGDVFVNGPTIIGSPLSGTYPGAPPTGSCVNSGGLGCTNASAATVKPRSPTDTTPTVSVLNTVSPPWTQDLTDNSSAWPAAGDGNPFGTRGGLPQPSVAAYVLAIQAAVGSNLTGTFQGSPVYNLDAIFAALGTTTGGQDASGALKAPTGCTCGAPTGNCAIYCQLQPLAIKRNPATSSSFRIVDLNASQWGSQTNYFIDGVANTAPCTPECFSNHGGYPNPIGSGSSVSNLNCPWNCTGVNGAQRLLNFTAVSSDSPILLANGNVWFWYGTQNHVCGGPCFGTAIQGKGTIVSTGDTIVANNLLYKNGLGPTGGCTATSTAAACDPKQSDMLGIISARDIYYGTLDQSPFNVASAIMLAARNFDYMFFFCGVSSCPPTTPLDPIIMNGTLLANNQVSILRDYVDTSASLKNCNINTTPQTCRPARFTEDPTITCGPSGTPGCWQFVKQDPVTKLVSPCAVGDSATLCPAGSTVPFKECQNTAGTTPPTCPAGSRPISHYQLTLNYDYRLFGGNSLLVAPALSLAPSSSSFANSWANWQECPTASACP